MFLGFTACFLLFQYQREREFAQEKLNNVLGNYNYQLFRRTQQTEDINQVVHQFIDDIPQKDLRVTIIDPAGKVLFDNSGAEEFNNHNDRSEVRKARLYNEGFAIRSSNSTGKRYFYTATNIGGLRPPLGPLHTARTDDRQGFHLFYGVDDADIFLRPLPLHVQHRADDLEAARLRPERGERPHTGERICLSQRRAWRHIEEYRRALPPPAEGQGRAFDGTREANQAFPVRKRRFRHVHTGRQGDIVQYPVRTVREPDFRHADTTVGRRGRHSGTGTDPSTSWKW